MAEIIEGKFRRVKRRAKAKSENESQLNGWFDNPQPWQTPPFNPATDVPIGVQAWEYLNQDKVQQESVAITGHNNPNALDNNVFKQIEDDVRGGADAAAAAAQKVLNTGSGWLTIAAIVFVLFNILGSRR